MSLKHVGVGRKRGSCEPNKLPLDSPPRVAKDIARSSHTCHLASNFHFLPLITSARFFLRGWKLIELHWNHYSSSFPLVRRQSALVSLEITSSTYNIDPAAKWSQGNQCVLQCSQLLHTHCTAYLWEPAQASCLTKWRLGLTIWIWCDRPICGMHKGRAGDYWTSQTVGIGEFEAFQISHVWFHNLSTVTVKPLSLLLVTALHVYPNTSWMTVSMQQLVETLFLVKAVQ